MTTPGEQPTLTRFSTVTEVAAVLRISKMSVYRLIHAGDIPAVQLGRVYRIPTKALWDYIKGATVSTDDVGYAPAVMRKTS